MRKGAVTVGGKPVDLKGEAIAVGMKAPDFKAVKQDMGSFEFYQDTAGKVKIISVAHSIDTGICSLQTIHFNQEAGDLAGKVDIVTITVDLPFAQKRFCAAEGIDNIHVVSDHRDLNFGEQYGFVIDELRLLARGIVVVDRDNIVRYVQYVPEVGTEPDYDKAMEVVRELIK